MRTDYNGVPHPARNQLPFCASIIADGHTSREALAGEWLARTNIHMSDHVAKEIKRTIKENDIDPGPWNYNMGPSDVCINETPANQAGVSYPEFSDKEVPISELWEMKRAHFRRREQRAREERDCVITINTDRPVIIDWFGDPHIDNNYCDVDKLLMHINAVESNDLMFMGGLGDYLDLWVGRLAKKYASAHTTRNDGYRLFKDMMDRLGPKIIAMLLGNHDEWAEDDLMSTFIPKGVPVFSWEAKFGVRFATGMETKFHIAHDFKGNSQYHNLHGVIKQALHRPTDAIIHLTGHKHCDGLIQQWCPQRRATVWAGRASGFKQHDEYATVNGFADVSVGESILTVHDPQAADPELQVHCFNHLEKAMDYHDSRLTKWHRRNTRKIDRLVKLD